MERSRLSPAWRGGIQIPKPQTLNPRGGGGFAFEVERAHPGQDIQASAVLRVAPWVKGLAGLLKGP